MLLKTWDEVRQATTEAGCTQMLKLTPNYYRFMDPNSRRRFRVIKTPGGFDVRIYHTNKQPTTNLVTDADRRNEPPEKNGVRGRKPKTLFTRLISNIEIQGSDPELKWSIPDYSLQPIATWPYELHKPWLWIGNQYKKKPQQRDLVQNGQLYRVAENGLSRPRFTYQKTKRSPTRLFYELMIGPLQPRQYLKPQNGRGDPMNVNPIHYTPTRYNAIQEWNFSPADFEEPPEEQDMTEDEPDLTTGRHNWTQEDIVSFAENLEEKILFGKIKSYEDFRNYFQPEFDDFDATEDDIRAIVAHANLLWKFGYEA